jgi:lipoprotein-anchoring transpeptidase ErfK/SrfK
MRTIIAQTADRSLVVVEIHMDRQTWYEIQDGQQSTLAQGTSKRAMVRAWRTRTAPYRRAK